MIVLKGRFLGEPRATKSGKGFMRRFLSGDDLYMVYADNEAGLRQDGEVSIRVGVQELVFLR